MLFHTRLRSLILCFALSLVLLASMVAGLRPAVAVASSTDQAAGNGPLRAVGGKIMDANGTEVRITGVNWFGLETGTFAPHGLWSRNLDDMMDQIAQLGFNTIRLPYSNQLFDPTSTPTGIDFQKNPDLVGLSGLQIMDKVVAGAEKRGLKIILDRHRPDAGAQSELWYTSQYDEQRWIHDWVMLADRYKDSPAVIGADLHNEPHGPATWGTGDLKTDWRLAAERCGNAILKANPNWLIIVEGVERVGNDNYWWGGNLLAAGDYPVRLDLPDHLVYSAHDYGPGVFNQSWFTTPQFPANLPKLWDDHWGYLAKNGTVPIILGEFGGRSVDMKDTEGVWQRSLMDYIQQSGISYTYWSLNPNSGDTGGVLNDDWTTVNEAKHDMLAKYQWPLIGKKELPRVAATPAPPANQANMSAIVPPDQANKAASDQHSSKGLGGFLRGIGRALAGIASAFLNLFR